MIEAVFDGNQNEVTVSGLTQWDRGRKLKIMLNDMPDKFEVHFATEGRSVAEVVEVATNGEYAVADIPNRILQKRENAIAYVYYADGDAGRTVKIIHLPIKPRPMPSDYLYEEGDVLAYSRVIQLLETVKKGDDGKSAYQIWLDAGNIGDEAAFLASLEGATGAKGEPGEPGATGPQGPAGKNGSDASVTTENIKTALGYMPADEDAVSQLSEEIEDLKNDSVSVTYDASTKTLNISSGSGGEGNG